MTHGTFWGYTQGCRCAACRQAKAVYVARWRDGRVGAPVDAASVRARLTAWQAAGIGLRRAATLTGVHRSTLQAILAGLRPQIQRSTERAILAVTQPSLAGGALVSPEASYETREALRRLLEEEYPMALLTQGLPGATIHSLALGGKERNAGTRVTVRTWQRVKRLRQRLMGDADTEPLGEAS